MKDTDTVSRQTLIACLPHVAQSLLAEADIAPQGLPKWSEANLLQQFAFLLKVEERDPQALAFIDELSRHVRDHRSFKAASTWQQLIRIIESTEPDTSSITQDLNAVVEAHNRARQLLEQKRFEKAAKVRVWDDWVFWDEGDLSEYGGKDGYFESINALKEAISDYNDDVDINSGEWLLELPPYVWCCKPLRMAHHTVEDLFAEPLETAAFEDSWDVVPKEVIAELQAALDKFYAFTDTVVGYLPDYSKALLLGD